MLPVDRRNPAFGPGHQPTCIGGNPQSLPKNDLRPYQFGQPGAPVVRHGCTTTSKQRQCMEALDRGENPKSLMRRFPAGMVRRLRKLQQASEDPTDKFFIQAQILIRQILITPKSRNGDDDEAKAAATRVEVYEGRLEVPMPGAPGDIDGDAPETKVG